MRKRAAAALMAWMVMQATPAAAQDWLRSYGGSGRDSLREIVSVGDGILAAGSTTSSDGDLSIRTREGKTGWLLRLGADGSVLWNFCSSRDGKAEICSPFVHDNGCVSCVLTGERGQEWIELNERGRAEKRVAVPDVTQLCRHERQGENTPSMLCRMIGRDSRSSRSWSITATERAASRSWRRMAGCRRE